MTYIFPNRPTWPLPGPFDAGLPWWPANPPNPVAQEEARKRMEDLLKGQGQTDVKPDLKSTPKGDHNASRIEALEKRVKQLEDLVDRIDGAVYEAQEDILELLAEKEKADTPSSGVPAEIDDGPTKPVFNPCPACLYGGNHPWWCRKAMFTPRIGYFDGRTSKR